MNKRGFIKFTIILISVIVSFYFMIETSNSGFDSLFNIVIICDFLIALTIFMFSYKDVIKKNKFMYDVFLMLLILFSTVYVLYFLYVQGDCFFDTSCSMESNTNFAILYPIFLFTILLFSIKDIFKKTNKINDILAIIASLSIILVHLRYYVEPNFPHKLITDHSFTQNSYDYIYQNYIYFIIMYSIVLVHYKVNEQSE